MNRSARNQTRKHRVGPSASSRRSAGQGRKNPAKTQPCEDPPAPVRARAPRSPAIPTQTSPNGLRTPTPRPRPALPPRSNPDSPQPIAHWLSRVPRQHPGPRFGRQDPSREDDPDECRTTADTSRRDPLDFIPGAYSLPQCIGVDIMRIYPVFVDVYITSAPLWKLPVTTERSNDNNSHQGRHQL